MFYCVVNEDDCTLYSDLNNKPSYLGTFFIEDIIFEARRQSSTWN